MRLPFIVVFVLGASCAAAEMPPDCVRLQQSKAPYELEMQGETGDIYRVQVYRGDDLYRTQVDKDLRKTEFQGNFALKTPLRLGEYLKSSYDIPTNKFIWDRKVSNVHVTSTIGEKK